MATKQWYKIYLNNGQGTRVIATVHSKGLAILVFQHLETIYPRERHFLLTLEK